MSHAQFFDARLEEIIAELEDYQISHGSLLKIPRGVSDIESTVAIARPIGVSVVPTAFPRQLFETALRIRGLFDKLYIKLAESDSWLEGVVSELRNTDDFANKLWTIWERVRDEGEVQPWRCGIFRSDYMIHNEAADDDGENQKGRFDLTPAQLKQVEFNTYSCAGASHATIVADMHRYLATKGVYGLDRIHPARLPRRTSSIRSIAELLSAANRAYGAPVSKAKRTAVLMTVQPFNVNICDERPIEYALSELENPVSLYRIQFSDEVIERCSLGPNRELLLMTPGSEELVEVSVVYQRAGYDAHEYSRQGVEARYMLERSRAIKCPTLLSHITGFKKVQQELTQPGTLEQWLSAEESRSIRQTFMPMYPLDNSAEGIKGRRLAITNAKDYILKPSREGGGNNLYGESIPGFLHTLPRDQWKNYVLMERIKSPSTKGILISPAMVHRGPVVSELGTLSMCLWKRVPEEQATEIIMNSGGGWTFKTKPVDVEEMSVVKGYGCFDSPYFSDEA
ncbi:glutathione synthetase [Xylariomycetidae sp. FL2044]|nr:glutathione synthetase [Xylariomycetidae sp. FL2044]